MQCEECGSEFRSLGTRLHGRQVYRKFKCNNCGHEILLPDDASVTYVPQEPTSVLEKDFSRSRRIVISSAQNNTEINHKFFAALKLYCDFNSADLAIIPLKYRNNEGEETVYPEEIQEWLTSSATTMKYAGVKLLGNLRISPTAENPLAGLDPLSKGYTIIVGHPQVHLKTLPQHQGQYPSIIATTGTISESNYIQSKVGYKAEFNHSFSAVVLEIDADGTYHIRHLNFDGTGFYDLNRYYNSNGDVIDVSGCLAIVTGDEHAIFSDRKCVEATYDEGGLVDIMRPQKIIRHDVLDSYTISHHHRNNFFTQYAKFHAGFNKIEDELNYTLQFIADTTPSYSQSLIVSSNHNAHLLRWLNEHDPKTEPWNARIYHKLMYMMLENTRFDETSGAKYPDPFELYARDQIGENIKFLSSSGIRIADIEVGYHGDIGSNGSRGSRKQFSILPAKTIIGHSHSPGITHGCYQVGTSSSLKLEYNKGPSSWSHAHCIIHFNGKRQLIFVIDGKFKA